MKTPVHLSMIGLLACFVLFTSGCAGGNPFPMAARAGDTVSIAIGYPGTPEDRKLMDRTNTTVTIDKVGGGYSATPPLRALFHLYPDPNSKIANYATSWLSTPAMEGDPFNTAVLLDLPPEMPTGNYLVTVSSDVQPIDFISSLEIIPGVGQSNTLKDNFGVDNDPTELERAPVAAVALDPNHTVGAISMVIDFDETLVLPKDINVQLPRYVFASHPLDTAPRFQKTQRMLYWREDGTQLIINILCPRGVDSKYLNFDILYPEGSPDPGFSIISQEVYDVNGNEIVGVGVTLG